MLEAIPKNWYFLDFDVHDRTGAHLSAIDSSNWSEKAELEVGGTSYEATHKNTSKDFVLSGADGAQILVAEKPSAWKERLVFEYGGNRYELKPESAWRRDFILTREGSGEVGSCTSGLFMLSDDRPAPTTPPTPKAILPAPMARRTTPSC